MVTSFCFKLKWIGTNKIWRKVNCPGYCDFQFQDWEKACDTHVCWLMLAHLELNWFCPGLVYTFELKLQLEEKLTDLWWLQMWFVEYIYYAKTVMAVPKLKGCLIMDFRRALFGWCCFPCVELSCCRRGMVPWLRVKDICMKERLCCAQLSFQGNMVDNDMWIRWHLTHLSLNASEGPVPPDQQKHAHAGNMLIDHFI